MPTSLTIDPALVAEIAPVYQLYAAMARTLDPEFGLGGKLVFAGRLNEDGTNLVRASNIASAASLSIADDPALQRHAIRNGVVDFLVNSLDEALRILKNEIRKRQAVAVALSAPLPHVVAEMHERGVLPDLLPPWAVDGQFEFSRNGATALEAYSLPPNFVLVALRSAPADFQATALSLLPPADEANRRWVKLSSRYLGPVLRRTASLACDQQVANELLQRLGPA